MKEERCTLFDPFETKTLYNKKMFVRKFRENANAIFRFSGRNKNHHLTHPDVKKYFIICFQLNGLITKRKKEQSDRFIMFMLKCM